MMNLKKISVSLVAISLATPPAWGAIHPEIDDHHFMSRRSSTFRTRFYRFQSPLVAIHPVWGIDNELGFGRSFWRRFRFPFRGKVSTLLPFLEFSSRMGIFQNRMMRLVFHYPLYLSHPALSQNTLFFHHTLPVSPPLPLVTSSFPRVPVHRPLRASYVQAPSLPVIKTVGVSHQLRGQSRAIPKDDIQNREKERQRIERERKEKEELENQKKLQKQKEGQERLKKKREEELLKEQKQKEEQERLKKKREEELLKEQKQKEEREKQRKEQEERKEKECKQTELQEKPKRLEKEDQESKKQKETTQEKENNQLKLDNKEENKQASQPVPIRRLTPKNRPLVFSAFDNSSHERTLSENRKGLDLERGSQKKKTGLYPFEKDQHDPFMGVSSKSTVFSLGLEDRGTVKGSKSFLNVSTGNKKQIENRRSEPLFKDEGLEFQRVCREFGEECSQKGCPEFITPEMAMFLFRKINELAKVKLPINKVISVNHIEAKSFVGETYIIKVEWGEEKEERVLILKYLSGEPTTRHPIANWTRPELEIKNVQSLRDNMEKKTLNPAGFSFMIPFFEGEYFFEKKDLFGSSKTRKLFTVQFAAPGRSVTDIVNKAFCKEKKKKDSKRKKPFSSKNMLHREEEKESVSQPSFQENLQNVRKVFRAIGKAIGEMQLGNNPVYPDPKGSVCDFYQAVRVLMFNDMHPDNIFWDPIKGASLIDIETLAYGLDENKKPRGLMLYDIFYFIQQTHKRFSKSALKKMEESGWIMYKDLIDGYISAFPQEEQRKVGAFIESSMRNSKTVKFTDYHKVFGINVAMGKAPDDSTSSKIIGVLCKHLENYRKD